MRRADRLFQVIQVLRRRRRLTTARDLAEELEVSVRTIYRDVADLVGSGVPIEGEAGLGYVLRDGYDLPPLMFTLEEIEAIVLGAKIVGSWGDERLGKAAEDALAKIEHALPERQRRLFRDTALFAPDTHRREQITVDMAALRGAVRESRKVAIAYEDLSGGRTKRTIWPLGLAFFGPVWLMIGWCELREDFRSFRVDRMRQATVLDHRYPPQPGRRLADYFARERYRA